VTRADAMSRARHARAVRAVAESALAVHGWPWSRSFSWWLEALLVVEEASS
jgi:hypothetical protein